MTDREAFLAAIEKDPYDLHTRKVYADWLDELMAFPEAVHDDQVDATAGAFNKLALRQPATKEKPTSVASRITVPRSMQFDRRGGGMFGRR